MTITGALVLFSITWFMVFFCVLPLRFTSQEDQGEVVPGTPRSAPADHMLGKKAKVTTLIAVIVWAALCAVILWGGLTVDDVNIFGLVSH